MKYVTVLTSTIVLAGAMALGASAAVAAPKGPAPKSTILHCGCTLDGTDMEYTEIQVNSRSRGHDAHVAGTIDSCFDGIETYVDVMRTGDDCQLSGPPLGDPIGKCDDFEVPPLAGDDCGIEPGY